MDANGVLGRVFDEQNNGLRISPVGLGRVAASTEADLATSNTAAETTVATFATPTGVTAGDRLILRVGGDVFNNSAGAVTYTFRFKLGATTFMTTNAISVSQNVNQRHFYAEITIALVSTNSERMAGFMSIGPASADTLAVATGQNFGTGIGSAAEDLITSKNVLVTVQMGTADPSSSFTLRQASLEYVRKP